MSVVNLEREKYLVDDGLDSKVVIRDLADVPGGRALNVSDFEGEVVKAGHIIVKSNTEEDYKPLAVSGNAYAAIPEGYHAIGVLKASVRTAKPAAAILTMGQVNAACSPFPVTAAIKAALPGIVFLYA